MRGREGFSFSSSPLNINFRFLFWHPFPRMFAYETIVSNCVEFLQEEKFMSEFSEKLNAFLSEYGVRKSWFAKKIGTTIHMLYTVLQGTHSMPVKCWAKTIELTDGKITLSDLMKDKFKDNPYIQVIEIDDPNRCEVRAKGFANTMNNEFLDK